MTTSHDLKSAGLKATLPRLRIINLFEQSKVRHLTAEEMQALLDAPDPTGWKGIRDRAMLHLCYAGGLRASELIASVWTI